MADFDPQQPAAEAASARRPKVAGLLPHALIFFSSACIMVIELVAGRLIARHLGSSLYTWTSIIGVVLAGMSIGNAIGGRMADRAPPRAFLGWLFTVASMCCLLTLVLNASLSDHSPLEGLHWPARVFFTVLLIFLLPAFVLGTISPATAKLALERSERLGQTIGSVYAWGAVGSIVGTLATGFWLISALGVQGVVLVIALGLALVGLGLGPRRWAHGAWALLIVGLLILSRTSSAEAATVAVHLGLTEDTSAFLFAEDGDYQYVKVYRKRAEDRDDGQHARTLRVLALDHLIHGYIDPEDPRYLHYRYERVYRDVARRYVGQRRRIAAFFIGGGSYTFPRLVRTLWPGSRVDVAEIDPLVLYANHQALGLPRDTAIHTHLVDARNAVDDMEDDRRYDLIFGDAFNDLSVPAHLVTVEFTRKLAAHLEPHGAYLLNVIDDFRSGLFLCAMVETMKRVFAHVYVFTTSRWGVSGGRSTFVAAGSQRPLEVADWGAGHSGPHYGSVLSAQEMGELRERCDGRVLTDDAAPVENLLQPVVSRRE